MQLRALISLVCLLAALVASAPSAEILEDRGLPEAEDVATVAGLSKAVSPEATLGQPQEAFDVETDSIVPEQEEVLAEVGSATNVGNSPAATSPKTDLEAVKWGKRRRRRRRAPPPLNQRRRRSE